MPCTNVRSLLRGRLVGQAGLCRRANEDNAEHLPHQVRNVCWLTTLFSATSTSRRFCFFVLPAILCSSRATPHGVSDATGDGLYLKGGGYSTIRVGRLCSLRRSLNFLVDYGARGPSRGCRCYAGHIGDMFFVHTLSRALQPMLTLPLIRAECDQGHDRRPRLWVVTLLCQRPCLFEA